jgi:cytochrome c-type biogenesis protein CcmH
VLVVGVLVARRRSAAGPSASLSAEEQARLNQLLDNQDK